MNRDTFYNHYPEEMGNNKNVETTSFYEYNEFLNSTLEDLLGIVNQLVVISSNTQDFIDKGRFSEEQKQRLTYLLQRFFLQSRDVRISVMDLWTLNSSMTIALNGMSITYDDTENGDGQSPDPEEPIY